jgi:hypothetical protein
MSFRGGGGLIVLVHVVVALAIIAARLPSQWKET